MAAHNTEESMRSSAPLGWEDVPCVVPEFHPEVIAHEQSHPLRGWGTDVACIIAAHLDEASALQLSNATRTLRDACRGDPTWAAKKGDVAEKAGTKEMERNNGPEALVCFNTVTSLCPQRTSGWVKLAQVQMRMSNFDAALVSANRAIALDALAPEGHLAHFAALTGLNRRPEATAARNAARANGVPLLFEAHTSITCAFEDKDQAKRVGCRWNPANKTWFAPQGLGKGYLMTSTGEPRFTPWGAVDLTLMLAAPALINPAFGPNFGP